MRRLFCYVGWVFSKKCLSIFWVIKHLIVYPFKNNLTIDATGTISKVAVFNVFGQEMLSFWPNTVSTTLPLDGLAVGVYFVEVVVDGRVGVGF
jgi:hypothetical protein